MNKDYHFKNKITILIYTILVMKLQSFDSINHNNLLYYSNILDNLASIEVI